VIANMTQVNVFMFLREFTRCDVISFDNMQYCDVIPFNGYNLKPTMRPGVVDRAAASSVMS
jgi:hypothetical protein